MNPDTEKLRKKYMDNLPDMDYFLNEDDLLDEGAGVEGFYVF